MHNRQHPSAQRRFWVQRSFLSNHLSRGTQHALPLTGWCAACCLLIFCAYILLLAIGARRVAGEPNVCCRIFQGSACHVACEPNVFVFKGPLGTV